MRTLLKRILPEGIVSVLKLYKGQLQGQWRTLRRGYAQPVVANDFLRNYDLNQPHQYAFALFYFAYHYRVARGQFVPLCLLRFLIKQQDIPQVADCDGKAGAFRKILRCSSMALLTIPEHVDQGTQIGAKVNTRNRKKAEKKHYTVRPIEYDEHLDEIYAINTSAEERGGKPMKEVYRQYPAKRSRNLAQLGIEFYAFGCFQAETLVAYATFIRYGAIFQIDKVLGHKQHLRSGIMNLLFFRIMEILSHSHAGHYLGYLMIRENTLGEFKRRLGFRPCNLLLPVPPRLYRAAKKLHPEELTGDWEQRYLETLDLQASLNRSFK